MTTKKTGATSASIKVPGVADIPYYHSPFAVFVEGVDLYSALRINGPVELALDDGKKAKATVQALQTGALIELIGSYGPQSIYTANRAYSALSLIQHLTDQGTSGVIDVTKLYLVVLVMPDQPEPVEG